MFGFVSLKLSSDFFKAAWKLALMQVVDFELKI